MAWALGLAAAGVALAAVLGGSRGGVSAPSIADQQQSNRDAGVGGIAGNLSKADESIKNSMSILEEYAKPEFANSNKMVSLLKSIDSNIGGTANALTSGGFGEVQKYLENSSKPSLIEMWAGKLWSGIIGSTKQSSIGSGIKFDPTQTFTSAAQGVNASSYNTIQTSTKGALWGLFGGNSTSTQDVIGAPLDEELRRLLSNIIGQTTEVIKTASETLGISKDVIDAALNTQLGISKLETEGLTTEEIAKKINTQISAAMSRLGKAVNDNLGGVLQPFLIGAEEWATMLVRLANGVEVAGTITERLGTTAVTYTNILNKQGDVATELVRQSLILTETTLGLTSNVGALASAFTGSAQELSELYLGLTDVRTALTTLGFSANVVSSDLLKGAGGLDALQSGLDDFASNFLSSSEQMALKQAKMNDEFKKLGLETPSSAEAFKNLVLGLKAGGETSAEMLGRVLILSNGMSDLTTSIDAMTESSKKLQESIDDTRKSQLNPTELVKNQQYEFDKTYSMALATTGETRIGYADELAAILPDLSAAIKATSSSSAEWMARTAAAFGQAQNLANLMSTGAGATTVATVNGTAVPAQISTLQAPTGASIVIDNSAVVTAVQALNANIDLLRIEVQADVMHNAKTAKLLDRVIPDGQSVQVKIAV